MSKWIYRKPEPSTERGLCVVCNKNLQKANRAKGTFRPLCSPCDKRRHGGPLKPPTPRAYKKGSTHYRKHKKSYCEKCGFIPEHRCQLDVDHIDGNHNNNEVSNLQTLCANCHRLKSYAEHLERVRKT